MKYVVNLPAKLKFDSMPVKVARRSKHIILAVPFILFIFTGCASMLKSKVNFKKRASYCSLDQLVGPDTYYYSDHYQRKLKKSIKRIGRK
jgi:hypothetical protein